MFVSEGRPLGRARSALLAGSSCLELGYGRFMQTDPLGYGDGLNWYNYAHGDAVNGRDSSGTEEDDGETPTGNGGGAGGGNYGTSYNPLPTYTGSLIPGVISNGLQIDGLDAQAVQMQVQNAVTDAIAASYANASPSSRSNYPVSRDSTTDPQQAVYFNPLSQADQRTGAHILNTPAVQHDIIQAWTATILTNNEYDFKVYQNLRTGAFVPEFYGSSNSGSHGQAISYAPIMRSGSDNLEISMTFHTHPGDYNLAFYPSLQDVTAANPYSVIVMIGVRNGVGSSGLRLIYGK